MTTTDASEQPPTKRSFVVPAGRASGACTHAHESCPIGTSSFVDTLQRPKLRKVSSSSGSTPSTVRSGTVEQMKGPAQGRMALTEEPTGR